MIPTWGNRSEFDYTGSLDNGTEISYGNGNLISVSAQQYQAMLVHFRGQVISVSPERTNPAVGSLEQWLTENVTATAIASYVAPILVREGVAIRTQDNRLRFHA